MCVFFFSFLGAFWTDKPLSAHFMASMILTDVVWLICNAETKFLYFHVCLMQQSKPGSPRFLREREHVLAIIRDAWNWGQISFRDTFFKRSIGDPGKTLRQTVSVQLKKKSKRDFLRKSSQNRSWAKNYCEFGLFATKYPSCNYKTSMKDTWAQHPEAVRMLLKKTNGIRITKM